MTHGSGDWNDDGSSYVPAHLLGHQLWAKQVRWQAIHGAGPAAVGTMKIRRVVLLNRPLSGGDMQVVAVGTEPRLTLLVSFGFGCGCCSLWQWPWQWPWVGVAPRQEAQEELPFVAPVPATATNTTSLLIVWSRDPYEKKRHHALHYMPTPQTARETGGISNGPRIPPSPV
jgi:hypothetical protein